MVEKAQAKRLGTAAFEPAETKPLLALRVLRTTVLPRNQGHSRGQSVKQSTRRSQIFVFSYHDDELPPPLKPSMVLKRPSIEALR